MAEAVGIVKLSNQVQGACAYCRLQSNPRDPNTPARIRVTLLDESGYTRDVGLCVPHAKRAKRWYKLTGGPERVQAWREKMNGLKRLIQG